MLFGVQVLIHRFILAAFAVLLVSVSPGPAKASNCTEEDARHAKSWNNFYAPDEAYSFGAIIIDLVKEKNLRAIFQHVDGELRNGPRRAFALSRSFDQIFGPAWRRSVIEATPECSPVGWRGFKIGAGSVWYNKIDGEWRITSIIGASVEEASLDVNGWIVDETLLHPNCFTRVWMSGDNFEEFAQQFGISDVRRLMAGPGVFLGKEIQDFGPIRPSWCVDAQCEKISLVKVVAACTAQPRDLKILNGKVSTRIGRTTYTYRVLSDLDNERCSALAPNVGAPCLQSFLVEVGDYSGGTMGWDMSYGIYGLFDLGRNGKTIAPLVFFPNLNEAMNYVKRDN